MDVIINDYSLSGQFSSMEDFIENLCNDIIPIIKYFKLYNCKIYKSYETFDRLITEDKKLVDILHIKGISEISKIKSMLAAVMSEPPYWNENGHNTEGEYIIENIQKCPECIKEATERKSILFSFAHEFFLQHFITVMKNSIKIDLRNIYNINTALNHLFEEKIINEHTLFRELKLGMKVIFLMVEDRNYTQEVFDNNNFTNKDRVKAKEKIVKLIEHITNKTDAGDLCKNLGNRLWEFRNNISDSRIFRIFYVLNNNKIIFLNGFVKKTQQTPQSEIDKARKLMKNI
ncbi:MAG: type II toxin-antitoxin system RelE/ParE family toxin [Clostridia bacterium]|nr:type II toxin-antitoxin system RelE/ParE family toxin [Clostridia bacterium]MDD4387113.1 type II toxin-antitoxin system RelE/ParE family toxin [Clostridia bacterium]